MWPKNSPAATRWRASVFSASAASAPSAAGRHQRVGPAVDQREHVAGVLGLDVAVAAQPHDLPPGRPHERAEPAHEVAIVHERVQGGVDARLERVMGADGDGGGRVVAVEDGQRAARRRHSRRLGQRGARLGDVREDGVEDDRVEGAVVERERGPAADDVGEVADAGGDLPRALARTPARDRVPPPPPRRGARRACAPPPRSRSPPRARARRRGAADRPGSPRASPAGPLRRRAAPGPRRGAPGRPRRRSRCWRRRRA